MPWGPLGGSIEGDAGLVLMSRRSLEALKQLGWPKSLGSGPLPACPAGEPVRWLEAIPRAVDPCRLARQVKQSNAPVAAELLHRPHEAAGVEKPRK